MKSAFLLNFITGNYHKTPASPYLQTTPGRVYLVDDHKPRPAQILPEDSEWHYSGILRTGHRGLAPGEYCFYGSEMQDPPPE